MTDSILNGTKKALGIPMDYDAFDPEITMHINTVFSTLTQLGVGPATGFLVEDDTTNWVDFLGEDANYSSVKSYVYLKVRLIFDPPATSFAIAAFEKLAEELEWRINVYRESTQYVPDTTLRVVMVDQMGDPVVIDGGTG